MHLDKMSSQSIQLTSGVCVTAWKRLPRVPLSVNNLIIVSACSSSPKEQVFPSLETWKSQQTHCSLQATGYENPILFESTLTNGKIALKYTILFLFMDVGLTPVFFIEKICIKLVYFNPILSQAPKQYLEMAKYMRICDKISLYFSLYYSTIQD